MLRRSLPFVLLSFVLAGLGCADVTKLVAPAKIEVAAAEGDDACTKLLDYCLRATCTLRNTGQGEGRGTLELQVTDEAGAVSMTESRPFTLGPGDTKTFTHDFTQAKLLGRKQNRVQCVVRSP